MYFLSYCCVNVFLLENIYKNVKSVNKTKFDLLSKLYGKATHVQNQLFSLLNDASADGTNLPLPHIVRLYRVFFMNKKIPNRIFSRQKVYMNSCRETVTA